MFLFKSVTFSSYYPSEYFSMYGRLALFLIYSSKSAVRSRSNFVKMMQARNIKPYGNTFAVLSVGCSRTLELDMAESFSDKISDKLPKNIHTFNTLLAACGFMVPIIGPSI
ncbi:hypothetical protein B296_00025362 [Ensete ventricosum]|uniref:Pentatricopeptide repeat-containing protein n=1 Tax=Ensete ventricosum TaxID=4639 RepID=A0A427AT77_ENSVE|nr:hypothetical protein B296_00025362 [Ensete ventricosum]